MRVGLFHPSWEIYVFLFEFGELSFIESKKQSRVIIPTVNYSKI